MRTTIDLPDELYRQAKSRAALQGRKLKDFVTECVRQGLAGGLDTVPGEHYRSPLPTSIKAAGGPIPALTNDEIASILDEEDAEQPTDLPDVNVWLAMWGPAGAEAGSGAGVGEVTGEEAMAG